MKYFSPNCKTHNTYIAGNMDTLTQAMDDANKEGTAQYPQAEFAVRRALADGDLVAVHTELLSNKSKQAKVVLGRFIFSVLRVIR